jgi:hypothetical protein
MSLNFAGQQLFPLLAQDGLFFLPMLPISYQVEVPSVISPFLNTLNFAR